MGVFQGNILPPVLLILKINNTLKTTVNGSESLLFGDDFALCVHAKSLPRAKRLLQHSLNNVQDWVSNSGF